MRKPLLGRLIKVLAGRSPGFTLIELVIVVALAGIVSVAIMATTFQVFSFSALASNQMTAIRQVQQAGFWVSPDVMMAQDIEPTGGSGFPLTMRWEDPGNHDVHEVTYRLEDMGNGRDRLVREHSINDADPDTMVVAEYIDPAYTSVAPDDPCSYPDCGAFSYTLTVTAAVGEQTETRTYEVKPRVGR